MSREECRGHHPGGTGMKITVVGAGYVGLSNAVLLAQKNEVCVLDIVSEKITLMNEKKLQSLTRSLKIT